MQHASSDAKPDAIELQPAMPANGYQNASKCAINKSSKHNSSAAEQSQLVNGLSSHPLPSEEPSSLGIKVPGDSAVHDLEGSSLEPKYSVNASAHDRSDVSNVS